MELFVQSGMPAYHVNIHITGEIHVIILFHEVDTQQTETCMMTYVQII